jgi:hypothetical protein
MGTSVVFDLIDQMVVAYRVGLPDVHVVDGDINTGDAGTFLMVGWDDPDNDRATSATGQQSWAGLGARARDEEGAVTCLVIAWNGDSDLDAARATVKAVTDTVEALHRADPGLAGTVPGLMWTGYGTRTELRQWLSDQGAVVTCTFEIAYKARI